MEEKEKKSYDGSTLRAKIELSGKKSGDTFPEMAVYALDRAGNTLETSIAEDDGQFEIPAAAFEKAHRVVVGPRSEEITKLDKKALSVFRPRQLQQLLKLNNNVLEISKNYWQGWFKLRLCVSGSVKKCFKFPWILDRYYLENNTFLKQKDPYVKGLGSIKGKHVVAEDFSLAKSLKSPFVRPFCRTICDGLIEVYRRTCCCRPWVIYDPRLPDLIRELEDIIPDPPEIKWPPRPQPDPGPYQKIKGIEKGALNKKLAFANQDLSAIQSLSPAELPEYINARPYLLCGCGVSTKVASGFINPNGEFHICWWERARLKLFNCHDEYAFVVKQNINGSTVTIYDGVTTNQWFHYGEFAALTSYHFQARTCRHNDFPGDGAFVLLQDIGNTGSYRLKTPDASGWDRVQSPVYNDGLAFPAANAAAAIGKLLDRNWGGTLPLRYHFSEEMKQVGAKYYRVSVSASDNNGNPTGTRTYLAPNEWKYYESIGSDVFIRSISLGANSAGGENNLYEIPFDADRDWQSGQYHAQLNTNQFNNGRFLVSVEVFNAAGDLIRPNGTADPGGSVEGGYTFRRWYQQTGPTAEVPFAALTHMFWWDNRKAEAKIEDFRVNGSINTGECQFLEDEGDANFSVGYRAYHPEPRFMLDHRLWWRRGLGGPSGILTNPHPNPNNVGVIPAAAHQSGNASFTTMLDNHSKCTFTINLHTNVKTFNGSGTLNGLDDWDQASMALAISD